MISKADLVPFLALGSIWIPRSAVTDHSVSQRICTYICIRCVGNEKELNCYPGWIDRWETTSFGWIRLDSIEFGWHRVPTVQLGLRAGSRWAKISRLSGRESKSQKKKERKNKSGRCPWARGIDHGLVRVAIEPVVGSHSFSSFAILLAIFLKPIDVPEMRLKRTPFKERRGSLQTSISHCTLLSVAESPCAHSNRNLSRCSYWHLLASST